MLFRSDFDVHFANYLNKNTLLPTLAPGTRWRHDQEMTHQARVELPLPKGFTLSAEWLGAYTNSTLAVFAYKRDVYTSAISWSY